MVYALAIPFATFYDYAPNNFSSCRRSRCYQLFCLRATEDMDCKARRRCVGYLAFASG
jgi:hypothetical protein